MMAMLLLLGMGRSDGQGRNGAGALVGVTSCRRFRKSRTSTVIGGHPDALLASAIGFSSGHLTLRQAFLASKTEEMKTSTTTPGPANPVETQTTQESIGFEREGNRIAVGLLTPIPRSVCLLTQLTSTMRNFDTTLRGTARNQPSILQYGHSFHTTLLQISLKLNNAFLVSNIYGYKIKLHGAIVSSKVKVVAEYLEKFRNSDRMIELMDLPLKDLKETNDQTLNLFSQIASQFGELVQLVDELISKSLTLKIEQARNATADVENEIRDLKRQQLLDEAAFYKELDNLKDLQAREADESQCYLKYNWRTLRKDIWYCPPPDSSRIRQANQSITIAKAKLENTIKLLTEKEVEAARKKEDNNELLMRRLENTGSPLSQLKNNLTEVGKNWNKLVSICGNIQSGAGKSLDIIKGANRTSTLWSNHLYKNISFNLNKTKEDMSLIETVMNIYLEGSDKHIMKTVLEIEEIMMKRENPEPGVLEPSLPGKCDT